MKCPKCGYTRSYTASYYHINDHSAVKRERVCKACFNHFSTTEVMVGSSFSSTAASFADLSSTFKNIELDSPNWLSDTIPELKSRGFVRLNDPRDRS